MVPIPPGRGLRDAPWICNRSGRNASGRAADNMRRIFLIVYRMVGNVDDAQELTQEVFIKALQHRDQLKDGVVTSIDSAVIPVMSANRFET